MNKTDILQEIKRTASANDGVPLGWRRFFRETGIKKSEWEGVYWARWNDALVEAGFAPNQLKEAYDEAELLDKYAKLALELGRLPTPADMRLKGRSDPEFPHDTTFSRTWTKAELVARLREHYRDRKEFEDVVRSCEEYLRSAKPALDTDESPVEGSVIGYVYLFKHGSRREYKIGRTNNRLRREGEVGIELPELIEPIHVIETDDPAGVEAYWHRRFADKRLNGEWFALTAEDVRAFKRWRRIN